MRTALDIQCKTGGRGVNRTKNRVQLLELTLPTPAENVALDEALLEAAEAGESGEVLRLWEPRETFVVVGRSSRVNEEVRLEACRTFQVPVIRRASGGAAIVAGNGCLMYAVVWRYSGREHLRQLDELHREVLGTVRQAIGSLLTGISHQGTCDLVRAGRKFSGNAVRCKRDHLLYHGTLLYDFDLTMIERFLGTAPRQPAYREGRSHGEFVTNLPLTARELQNAMITGFGAKEPLSEWPAERTASLVASRYTNSSWNFER